MLCNFHRYYEDYQIKTERIGRHVAHIKNDEKRIPYFRYNLENLTGRKHFRDQHIDRRILVQDALNKYVVDWIHAAQDRDQW